MPSDIHELVERQHQYFNTGTTRSLEFRRKQLQNLAKALEKYEGFLLSAMAEDMAKPPFEAYTADLVVIKVGLDFALRHLKKWMKPRRVPTPLAHFPAVSHIYPEPYGVSLIIAPWNYPVNLLLSPLVGAIAAGNCAILKPSELSASTSHALSNLISDTFDPDYIALMEGGVEETTALLEEHFDYIFYTGSTTVGKIIMAAAARHLTPVTLELGGKSPCIVEPDVDLDVTARRVVWGKFLNAGQTCVAPDYLLVHKSIKDQLLLKIESAIKSFYGEDPSTSPDYARIINDRHFDRLNALLSSGEVYCGGRTDATQRYIEPTVLINVTPDSPVMQEEMFGPLLPVIVYDKLEDALTFINARPKPLALYLFSRNIDNHEKVINGTSSGGMCINQTILHLTNKWLPFGGVGESGMGAYEGLASFDTFTHYKSVLKKAFVLDLPLAYPPYKDKLQRLKKLLRRVL